MKKLQIAVALTVLFGVPAILFAGASIVHLIAQVHADLVRNHEH